MTPAVWPRAARSRNRLLHWDPVRGAAADLEVRDLPSLLRAGDVLVVNDAATLPASLHGRVAHGTVEVRLAGRGATPQDWTAVLFGAGTWRTRTEDRPPPPVLAPGDRIVFAGSLCARIEEVAAASPRLVTLRFDRTGSYLWQALYAAGRPVQYSHLCGPLDLWHVQTAYAARPWAVEMPSAGHALTVPVLRALRRRGVRLAVLTHAAGLSSVGDPALDAILPLAEDYDIPARTAEIIEDARATGGRVVAVGTTVVRALEGCARDHGGRLQAGPGRTDLRLSAAAALQVVDGVLTGLHEPGSSHFELLGAFTPAAVLAAMVQRAAQAGYLAHEFGDVALILPAGRDPWGRAEQTLRTASGAIAAAQSDGKST